MIFSMLYAECRVISGSLPAAVFLHGDLQNSSVFNDLAAWFRRKGHSTLQVDLPGHGGSSHDPSDPSIIDMLHAELSTRGIQSPILIGHSSGAIVVAQYALKHGNASSIIALNSCLTNPLRFNPVLAHAGDFLSAKSRELFQKQERVDYSRLKGSSDDELRLIGLRTTLPEGLGNTFSFMLAIPMDQSLAKLAMPILMLNDPADIIIPFKSITALSKDIPRLKIEQLPGGHNIFLHDPERVIGMLEANATFIRV